MSAPYAPGGARTASETGSTTATNSAPAAWREPADLGHRLEQAEEVRLAGDHAGDRASASASSRSSAARSVVPAAGPVGDERDLVDRQAAAEEVGRDRLAVVAMDRPRHEDALAMGRPAGHQRRLGGRRGAVVVRGRDDVEPDELADQRLVLVDRLEGALADLGLVRRVGRVPLAAEQDLVDGGGAVVAVDAGPEERGEVDPVARREGLEARRELELRLGLRQVEAAGPRGLRRDVGEELVDRSTPIAASIRARSAGVCGPYGIWRVSPPRSARRRPPGRAAPSSSAGRLTRRPDHPAGTVRLAVDELGRDRRARRSTSTTDPESGANRSLTALTDSTTPKVAHWASVPADLGQLDEDDVAELLGGVAR